MNKSNETRTTPVETKRLKTAIRAGEMGAVAQAAASNWRGIAGNSSQEFGSMVANNSY